MRKYLVNIVTCMVSIQPTFVNDSSGVWENTATVSYGYDISRIVDGKSYNESVKDLFIFTYENSQWLAVWRKFIA